LSFAKIGLFLFFFQKRVQNLIANGKAARAANVLPFNNSRIIHNIQDPAPLIFDKNLTSNVGDFKILQGKQDVWRSRRFGSQHKTKRDKKLELKKFQQNM
jgi:hypothetical protein